MKRLEFGSVLLFAALFAASGVFAHCEIPCGIYGDDMRFEMMGEHIRTIEKSMNMIVSISGGGKTDNNQLIRWVMNKEDHAGELQHIITQYFLTQRVKPVGEEEAEAYQTYVHKLNLLHEMLVFSMKAKQSTDLGIVEHLESLLEQFWGVYFSK